MKIEIMLPVYASAMFEADIDVEGKTTEEIKDDFLDNCEKQGYLCHQCSRYLESDFEFDSDNVDDIGEEIEMAIARNNKE